VSWRADDVPGRGRRHDGGRAGRRRGAPVDEVPFDEVPFDERGAGRASGGTEATCAGGGATTSRAGLVRGAARTVVAAALQWRCSRSCRRRSGSAAATGHRPRACARGGSGARWADRDGRLRPVTAVVEPATVPAGPPTPVTSAAPRGATRPRPRQRRRGRPGAGRRAPSWRPRPCPAPRRVPARGAPTPGVAVRARVGAVGDSARRVGRGAAGPCPVAVSAPALEASASSRAPAAATAARTPGAAAAPPLRYRPLS
jgi:hypothetical protein